MLVRPVTVTLFQIFCHSFSGIVSDSLTGTDFGLTAFQFSGSLFQLFLKYRDTVWHPPAADFNKKLHTYFSNL